MEKKGNRKPIKPLKPNHLKKETQVLQPNWTKTKSFDNY